jgi:hypothetical protein
MAEHSIFIREDTATTSNITFTCKDELIAKHYDRVFRELFECHLAWTPVEALPELRQFMNMCMEAEARFQEHYDYEYTDDDQTDWQGRVIGKKRRVLLNEDGSPKLFIPEVKIEVPDVDA